MNIAWKLLLLTSVLSCTAGCANVSDAGYYWGNYANSLYSVTNAPSEETLRQHAGELEKIVEESQNRELKIPPGILAELGYTQSRLGLHEAAKVSYLREVETYPESEQFIQRLLERSPEVNAGTAE